MKTKRFRTPGDAVPRLFILAVAFILFLLIMAILVFTESGNPLFLNYSLRLWVLIILLGGITLWMTILGLKARSRSNQNAMMIILSLAFGFGLSETAIRLMEKDPWLTLRVVKKKREEGVQMYPLVNPVGSRLNRLAPLPNVLTLLGDEGYGWIQYHADENGFRNPKGLYTANERLDVFALGDSFGIGRDVPDEHNWTQRIMQLRKVTVYNAGVPAASPLQELAILREYGIPKRPRVVVWAYYDNDLVALPKELNNSFLKSLMPRELQIYFTCEDQEAPIKRMTDAQLQQWLDKRLADPIRMGMHGEDWRKKPIIRLLRLHCRIVDKLIELTDEQILYHEEILAAAKRYGELFGKILHTAKTEVERTNGRVLFVYLPIFAHWLPEYEPFFEETRVRTLGIAETAGLDILDMKAAIDRQEDVFQMYSNGREGGHFSIEGYDLLAREVSQYLAKNGL
jgi:hypothetical protein